MLARHRTREKCSSDRNDGEKCIHSASSLPSFTSSQSQEAYWLLYPGEEPQRPHALLQPRATFLHPGPLFCCPAQPFFILSGKQNPPLLAHSSNHFPLSESGLFTGCQRIWSGVSYFWTSAVTKEAPLLMLVTVPMIALFIALNQILCQNTESNKTKRIKIIK